MENKEPNAQAATGGQGLGANGDQARARHLRGLSTKLLVLTIVFVMLGEVLIYVPSIANFRLSWLRDRVAVADVASLVLEAAPDNMVPAGLRDEILSKAGAKAIGMDRGGRHDLVLQPDTKLEVDKHFDLTNTTIIGSIVDAFDALFAGDGRLIMIVDKPRMGEGERAEIVIEEAPLRAAMLQYSINILTLSIVLSLLTI